MRGKLTTWILIAMVAGIAVGYMCHMLLPTPEMARTVASYISLITDLFLRRIGRVEAGAGVVVRDTRSAAAARKRSLASASALVS